MIQRVDDAVIIKELHTPYQFHLLTAPPKREAIFLKDKLKFGCTFAFHGSSIENWHRILRTGLASASGTTLQVNGAAYGHGVYLSPQCSLSLGYSRFGYGGGQKRNPAADGAVGAVLSTVFKPKEFTVLALCEVVKSPTLKMTHNGGNIWVQANADHVVTRMLFVFENGKIAETVWPKSTDTAFVDSLNKAIGV